jgi:ATP-dependent DNA helicase RecG
MSINSENSSYTLTPSTPVQYLKGVGPARAKVFEELGVATVGDLLEYYPRDWRFMPPPSKIGQVEPGTEVTIAGLVESVDFKASRRPQVFEAVVGDETGMCRVIWFNGGYLRNQLTAGQVLMASGAMMEYKHRLQLTNPKFVILEDERQASETFSNPAVYPASGQLSSNQIKYVIAPLLEKIDSLAPEFFSAEFRKRANLIGRNDAFKWIHKPGGEEGLAAAKRRLKYDELFLMQAGLAIRRYRAEHFEKAAAMKLNDELDSRIRRRFPFLLTEDQNAAIAEIAADMSATRPMNRLLQGDVGSGKTVVALYAALLAVGNKAQVAMMAPTEILAGQHFASIERFLKDSAVRYCLITGGMNPRIRGELGERIKSGQMDIVVGTIALLREDITFANLGLAIIDEQHKFGVEQRSGLRKDVSPHNLVMTATPIPRTLAMTVFGDLDVSVIKHSPPGRGTVVTRHVAPGDRAKAYQFIADRLEAGKQAYFVYPRITGEENGEIKAAVDEYRKLKEKVFPKYRVELLHGQMPAAQKQEIMARFRGGKIDVLVSTVVIEVGVDVPNATIMVIEEADRFGLAQLHQLRGRIGRGESKSYCLLFAETDSEVAASRLEMMTRSHDGFEIAEHDLRLRGPGELFSTRQHGLPDLKIADIIDDFELLAMARRDAFECVKSDPGLRDPANREIRAALIKRFGNSISLADIG